jgi:tetratricopeptide (TPR) repeat protein
METENQVFILAYLHSVEKFRDDVKLREKLGILFPEYPEDSALQDVTRVPVVKLLGGHLPGNSAYSYYPVGMSYQLLKEKPPIRLLHEAWKNVRIRGIEQQDCLLNWSMRKFLVWNHVFHAEYLRMTDASPREIYNEYQQASKCAGSIRDMHHNLGGLFHRLGNLALALQDFKLEVKTYPFSEKSMLNVGIIYRYINSPEDAIPWFEQALHLDPDNPFIRKNLGFAMLETPKYQEEGKKLLKEFLNEFPGDTQAETIKRMIRAHDTQL